MGVSARFFSATSGLPGYAKDDPDNLQQPIPEKPDIPYTGRESPTLGKQVAAGHRARRWRLRYLSCYDNRMLDSIFSDLQCRRLWSHTMYIAKMY